MDHPNLNLLFQPDKVVIFPFEEDHHFSILQNWSQERVIPFKKKDIPKIGFFTFYEKKPIAAGFLRKCEGGIGMFDSFIADPFSEFEIRDTCLDKIVECLIRECKNLGLYRVFAFTKNQRILSRAYKHGFISIPHQLISLELMEGEIGAW